MKNEKIIELTNKEELTKEDLRTLAKEIKKFEAKKKAMEASIDELKSIIKTDMEAHELEEVIAGEFTIRNKEVTSDRFDTTRFKKENVTLYEMYLKSSTSKRFTING